MNAKLLYKNNTDERQRVLLGLIKLVGDERNDDSNDDNDGKAKMSEQLRPVKRVRSTRAGLLNGRLDLICCLFDSGYRVSVLIQLECKISWQ